MRTWYGLCLLCLITTARAGAETIRIGWIGPLSGNSSVLGIDSVRAAQLALDEANADPKNAHRFELLAEDDAYDTARTVSAYSKLASQKVVAIFVSTYGGVFALAARAERDGILLIDPLDCNDEIAKLPGSTLCIATQSESVAHAIAEDVRSRKLFPAAIVFDERNPFMTLVAGVLKSELGSSVASFAGVDQSATDFQSELPSVRSKEVKSLIFLGHDPMGTGMRKSKDIGITAQLYTLGTITSPGFQQLAGPAAEGALVAYWEAPGGDALAAFLERFEHSAGRAPILQLASVPTYDAAMLLISATKDLTTVNPSDLLSYLLRVKDYPGLSGRITIDPDGATRSIRETIYRYNGGKLKKVNP